MVRDSMTPARLAPCGDLSSNGVGVSTRELAWSHDNAHCRFRIAKADFWRPAELDLRRIHEVKDYDVMSAMAPITKGGEREIAVEQEIGNEHHHAASSEQSRQTLQRRVCRGPLTIWSVEETANDTRPLTGFDAGRDDLPHLLIERHKTRRIALAQENECERRSQPVGVRTLRESLWRAAPRHRTTRIDQDHRAKVRFLFELFDEQAIGTSQDPPIEIAELIPGLVGSVLGEFHGESAKGRSVQTRQKPFHHACGDDLDAP